MKKSVLYLMIMGLSLSTISTTAFAVEKEPTTIVSNPKEIPEEVKVMLNRLEEIKNIDRSTMNRTERKALRKEVRAIKDELRTTGNGIYISVGAALIILLLIIIL
jgi:hypothetical protein